MDLILAVIAALIIGATSVVTAVGVGIGCFSCGAMYQYRANETEIHQIKHELKESREHFVGKYRKYIDEVAKNQRVMNREYNGLNREIKRLRGGI